MDSSDDDSTCKGGIRQEDGDVSANLSMFSTTMNTTAVTTTTSSNINMKNIRNNNINVYNTETFISKMKEQQLKLEALKRQEAYKLQQTQAALASIEAELEDTKSWVKRMESSTANVVATGSSSSSSSSSNGNHNDNTIPSSTDEIISVVMSQMLKLFRPMNQKLQAMDHFLVAVKHNVESNHQNLDNYNQKLDTLMDRFEKMESCATENNSNSDNQIKDLNDQVRELQSKVKQEELIRQETFSKQQNLSNKIKIIKNELKDKLQYKRYFSKFELIIDSWMTSILHQEKANQRPLFFCHLDCETGGYVDIKLAGLAFANVLQQLKIKTSNKFIYINTSNQTEIETVLNNAESVVLYLHHLFHWFHSNVSFIEYVLKEVKKKQILLIVVEDLDTLDSAKQRIPKLNSLLLKFNTFSLYAPIH